MNTQLIEKLLLRDKDYIILMNQFGLMGFQIIGWADTENSAGADLHIQKDNLVLRVEVKKARVKEGKKSAETPPVEEDRKNDDLIAIVFPSGYVLIEPMKHHLKCCSEYGSRSFYGLC